MDWLAFSLSNQQQPCFFEPFAAATAPRHERAEDEVPATPTGATGDCPKIEDFLGGRFAGEGPAERGAYDSELKSIAAGFLRGAPPEQEELSKAVVVVEDEDESRKAVDTFGQRTSIYRGVTRHRWTGRYEAHLWDNSCRREGQTRKGRQVYLGGYDKEEKAARAYDLAALKYWGPTTTTNFPVSTYEKELDDMKNMSRQEFVASLRRKSSGFSRGASIYRGVTRHHQHGRWQARIGRVAGNKDLYLGTFSTQEEAAEAYDIAAIKFRGPNAVTNFNISRYDVKSIMSSNLPIGGMSGRSSSKSSDSLPRSEAKMLPLSLPPPADLPASSLNLMITYHNQQQHQQQQEQTRQHDYWSLVALHQQGHQNQYFNLFPPAISYASGSIAPAILPEHGGYDWGVSEQSQSRSIEIPYATPIAVYDGTGSGNWVTASANAAPVQPYHQPATIFGIE